MDRKPGKDNGLYKSKHAFEVKVGSLFSVLWKGYEVYNISGFIGQYCQGNQPDHSYPFLYYFVGKQEKSQIILDSIMNHFYDLGKEHFSYAGMDDAGKMLSWYVFNTMGFYPFSPADPKYIVSVPLFKNIQIKLANGKTYSIVRKRSGKKISSLNYGGKQINGYWINDKELKEGKMLVINTE